MHRLLIGAIVATIALVAFLLGRMSVPPATPIGVTPDTPHGQEPAPPGPAPLAATIPPPTPSETRLTHQRRKNGPTDKYEAAEVLQRHLSQADKTPVQTLQGLTERDLDQLDTAMEILLSQGVPDGRKLSYLQLLESRVFGLDKEGRDQMLYWYLLVSKRAQLPEVFDRLDISPEAKEFIARQFREPEIERVQRNAQNIASVANAAIAAGANFGDRQDPLSIAQLLTEGVNGSGKFASATFRMDISPEDLDLAETLLSYDKENRVITFTPVDP